VVNQTGPETAKKGMNVTIQYIISNMGNQSVNNVQIKSQQFQQNIGTLNPGDTKTFTSQVYIPTDAEVQQDFGVNATTPNPFFIGGFTVTYMDAAGNNKSVTSNSIQIILA